MFLFFKERSKAKPWLHNLEISGLDVFHVYVLQVTISVSGEVALLSMHNADSYMQGESVHSHTLILRYHIRRNISQSNIL